VRVPPCVPAPKTFAHRAFMLENARATCAASFASLKPGLEQREWMVKIQGMEVGLDL